MCYFCIHYEKPDLAACGNVRSVSEDVYSALMQILDGVHTPTYERNVHHKAAYRIASRRVACIGTVTNPLTHKKEKRILVNSKSGHQVILLKTSEVRSCINFYMLESMLQCYNLSEQLHLLLSMVRNTILDNTDPFPQTR